MKTMASSFSVTKLRFWSAVGHTWPTVYVFRGVQWHPAVLLIVLASSICSIRLAAALAFHEPVTLANHALLSFVYVFFVLGSIAALVVPRWLWLAHRHGLTLRDSLSVIPSEILMFLLVLGAWLLQVIAWEQGLLR